MAIKAGEVLRQKLNGRLHVIHITRYPAEMDWMSHEFREKYMSPELQDLLISGMASMLHKQVRTCEAECTHEVLFGSSFKVLTEAISRQGVDLLVMGYQGSGSHLFQMGSLTSKMIASSKVPLVVIKKHFQVKKLAGLIDPVDPNEKIFEACEELSFLLSAQPEFIAMLPNMSPDFWVPGFSLSAAEKIQLLARTRDLILEKLDSHLSAVIKVHFSESKNLADDLSAVMAREKIDLGVLSKHKRGTVEKFFIGSIARRLLDSFDGNLLLIST